ncbi:MAG: hypothetical protein OES79_10160, partial [Planctomycetota bacterium]|nr:hypothetical protein [Planctomycetota bacterium]
DFDFGPVSHGWLILHRKFHSTARPTAPVLAQVGREQAKRSSGKGYLMWQSAAGIPARRDLFRPTRKLQEKTCLPFTL